MDGPVLDAAAAGRSGDCRRVLERQPQVSAPRREGRGGQGVKVLPRVMWRDAYRLRVAGA